MNSKDFVITYYKNRKLYSNVASRYVNLRECKELLDEGYSLTFIEHGTGKNVTERCLKEMLCKFSVSQDILIRVLSKAR